jgi:hypothetical protein
MKNSGSSPEQSLPQEQPSENGKNITYIKTNETVLFYVLLIK